MRAHSTMYSTKQADPVLYVNASAITMKARRRVFRSRVESVEVPAAHKGRSSKLSRSGSLPPEGFPCGSRSGLQPGTGSWTGPPSRCWICGTAVGGNTFTPEIRSAPVEQEGLRRQNICLYSKKQGAKPYPPAAPLCGSTPPSGASCWKRRCRRGRPCPSAHEPRTFLCLLHQSGPHPPGTHSHAGGADMTEGRDEEESGPQTVRISAHTLIVRWQSEHRRPPSSDMGLQTLTETLDLLLSHQQS